MEKARKKSYYDIVQDIQQQIMSNELKFGDKLPPERELSETYSMSRNSVREALRTLEVIGLLESRHGEGNFITNRLSGYVVNALSLSFVLNKGTSAELLQMRRIIEVASARNIHDSQRKDDLELLQDIIQRYVTAETDEERLTLDELFHKTVVELSRNKLYIIIFQMLSALILPDMHKAVHLTIASDARQVVNEEHLKLLSAIENGDLQLFDQLLTKHLLLDLEAISTIKVSADMDLSFLQERVWPL